MESLLFSFLPFVIIIAIFICLIIVPIRNNNRINNRIREKWEAAGKIVCPNCGSDDLQSVSEVSGFSSTKGFSCCTGGIGALLLGPLGWLCGMCGMGKGTGFTTTSLLWVCKRCGSKFKNIPWHKSNQAVPISYRNMQIGSDVQSVQINTTRKCPYCGKDINKTADFCSFCGKNIKLFDDEKISSDAYSIQINFDRKCPFCGKTINKTAEFCRYCGSNIKLFDDKQRGTSVFNKPLVATGNELDAELTEQAAIKSNASNQNDIDSVALEKEILNTAFIPTHSVQVLTGLKKQPLAQSPSFEIISNGTEVTLLEKGEEIKLYGQQGYWVKIRTKSNKIGWCFSGSLLEL